MSPVTDDDSTPEDSGVGPARRKRGLVGRLRRGRDEEIPLVDELDAEDAAALLRMGDDDHLGTDDLAEVVARRGPSAPSTTVDAPEGDEDVDWSAVVVP